MIVVKVPYESIILPLQTMRNRLLNTYMRLNFTFLHYILYYLNVIKKVSWSL